MTPAPDQTLFSIGCRLGVDFCGCLRHKRLKRVEFTRVSPLAAAAWSCLSSEKISDHKKLHRNKAKNISYKM